MVLDIMERHQGWAAVIALVGGGQEIHGGEAGLGAWGDAINRHPGWNVTTSPEALNGGTSVSGSRLFRALPSSATKITVEYAAHLDVPRRSYHSDLSAAWVNAVLRGDATHASTLAASGMPIRLTRDLVLARKYLRSKMVGNRRAGLVASSGAARLRAEGVEPPTFRFLSGIDYVKWFLQPAGDFRSSNQLEVALSEFELQGLELDHVGLLWGGDLVCYQGRMVTRRLKGTHWSPVSAVAELAGTADDPETRILNKYRVLMTRFRTDMVIFVPRGEASEPSRLPADFDSVYDHLLRSGASPLGISEPFPNKAL